MKNENKLYFGQYYRHAWYLFCYLNTFNKTEMRTFLCKLQR